MATEMLRVVKKALDELENNHLIPKYEQHEETIKNDLIQAVQQETKLEMKMVDMINKNNNNNLEKVKKEMLAIIGSLRVTSIKQSLDIETYRMKLVSKSEDQVIVRFLRNKNAFHKEILLDSLDKITHAISFQVASVVIELFILIFSCIGIKIALNDNEMRAAANEVALIVREPAFQRALTTFLESWKSANGTVWRKAKAIFFFLKNSYSLGYFWTIVKLIYTDMTTLEKIRAMAEVTLMIVAAFFSEGAALIARIALAVDGAVSFGQKITNLVTLSEMKISRQVKADWHM